MLPTHLIKSLKLEVFVGRECFNCLFLCNPSQGIENHANLPGPCYLFCRSLLSIESITPNTYRSVAFKGPIGTNLERIHSDYESLWRDFTTGNVLESKDRDGEAFLILIPPIEKVIHRL